MGGGLDWVGYTFGWLYKGCANSADEAHFQFLIEFSWRLMSLRIFFSKYFSDEQIYFVRKIR
jgi:hypothetical protein